jgi:DNA-directed RNA polymerase I subunit RPA1
VDANGNRQGGAKKETGEADKYLAPLEVEAQIKLLWEEHAEFLNFIWSRSLQKNAAINLLDLKKADAWKVFFMRNVVVTPNKFRPASIVGETMSEHPQNIHLKKIIELNSQIRLIQSRNVMNASSDGMEVDSPTPRNSLVPEDFQLSKLITAWIDLQNGVNSYMDSSKDPNAGNPEYNLIGIKQILERKEGLFRRHMMGKRVNFCCRSVISPDPYIGTNEIGIPMRFAKELYYPVPVNEWNVKYLRKLVEKGPDHYPGKSIFLTLFACLLACLLVCLFVYSSSMMI